MKRGSAVFARDREIQEGKDLCFVFCEEDQHRRVHEGVLRTKSQRIVLKRRHIYR